MRCETWGSRPSHFMIIPKKKRRPSNTKTDQLPNFGVINGLPRPYLNSMLFRFTVMMCVSIAVVGGKLRFWSGRPRDFWHCIFRHSSCFLGAIYCNLFYDCSSFGSLGEVFAHGGEFPLAFLIGVG